MLVYMCTHGMVDVVYEWTEPGALSQGVLPCTMRWWCSYKDDTKEGNTTLITMAGFVVETRSVAMCGGHLDLILSGQYIILKLGQHL